MGVCILPRVRRNGEGRRSKPAYRQVTDAAPKGRLDRVSDQRRVWVPPVQWGAGGYSAGVRRQVLGSETLARTGSVFLRWGIGPLIWTPSFVCSFFFPLRTLSGTFQREDSWLVRIRRTHTHSHAKRHASYRNPRHESLWTPPTAAILRSPVATSIEMGARGWGVTALVFRLFSHHGYSTEVEIRPVSRTDVFVCSPARKESPYIHTHLKTSRQTDRQTEVCLSVCLTRGPLWAGRQRKPSMETGQETLGASERDHLLGVSF